MVTDCGCLGSKTSEIRTLRGTRSISLTVNSGSDLVYGSDSLQTSMDTLVERVIRSFVKCSPLIHQSRRSRRKDRAGYPDSLIWGQVADTTVMPRRRGASLDVVLREARFSEYRLVLRMSQTILFGISGEPHLDKLVRMRSVVVGALIVRERLDIS